MKLCLKSMAIAFAVEFVLSFGTTFVYYGSSSAELRQALNFLQEPGISLDHGIFSHFGRSTIPRDFAVTFGVQWLIYTLLIYGGISAARALKRRRVSAPNERAAPNGGSAEPSGDSDVGSGPPSVS
jgi:hypothetical protein